MAKRRVRQVLLEWRGNLTPLNSRATTPNLNVWSHELTQRTIFKMGKGDKKGGDKKGSDKSDNKGKGKGKGNDKDDKKESGGKAKGAQSINVRHILVRKPYTLP